MKIYIILHNGGVWAVKRSRSQVKKLFSAADVKHWDFGEDNDGDDPVSMDEGIDRLIEIGACGESIEVHNEELCAYGDNYCTLAIREEDV